MDGGTACYCEEGFEDDPTDGDDIDNNHCRRYDPCNTYACDAIPNSVCALNDEVANCVCDVDFEPFVGQDPFVDSLFFENANTEISCVSTVTTTAEPTTAAPPAPSSTTNSILDTPSSAEAETTAPPPPEGEGITVSLDMNWLAQNIIYMLRTNEEQFRPALESLIAALQQEVDQ